MNSVWKIKRALRGDVSTRAVLLETGRRSLVTVRSRYERLTKFYDKHASGAAHLRPEFAKLTPSELLNHFRNRSTPRFFAGFDLSDENVRILQRKHFPVETEALLQIAHTITTQHSWPLLGFGNVSLGDQIDWLRDPVGGARWPLEFHAHIDLLHNQGGDVRVLWELNRLGHLLTLGRAFVMSGDELFAETFFTHVESWKSQNQFGYGPNWSCAMEVALRAMNLLAAFQIFRGTKNLTAERLAMLLTLFEQHGEFIYRHLEFSYVATSNHYLSDVVGLLWLGVCLPELEAAHEWRELGISETLREMDKQILSDGADWESSTGYHRFVLELFLFSFILCRANSVEVEEKYLRKLRLMLEYVRAYIRPDGGAPLIGDGDGGQVLPIVRHAGDAHNYLLEIGAAFFGDPELRSAAGPPEEMLWLLGGEVIETFAAAVAKPSRAKSAGFAQAGTYVLREDDLYLLFNASGTGINGRGSHSHNDALSIEVSACGLRFLGDPGTFVYTADLAQRHLFRSTSFHSTAEVDGAEQNTIEESAPFIIGNEACPRVLTFEIGAERERVIAEHYGYQSLPCGSITHRREVVFDKQQRSWLIADTLTGTGKHTFRFCFHIPPGLELETSEDAVEIKELKSGARLVVKSLDVNMQATLEPRWFSVDYGAKHPSVAACWTVRSEAPLSVRWLLLPICPGEDLNQRLRLVDQLTVGPIDNQKSKTEN